MLKFIVVVIYKNVSTSVLKELTKRIYLVYKLVYVMNMHRECTPVQRKGVTHIIE